MYPKDKRCKRNIYFTGAWRNFESETKSLGKEKSEKRTLIPFATQTPGIKPNSLFIKNLLPFKKRQPMAVS